MSPHAQEPFDNVPIPTLVDAAIDVGGNQYGDILRLIQDHDRFVIISASRLVSPWSTLRDDLAE
jgi:hypothetical protein